MQDSSLFTVDTKNEYNTLLTVSTKTKAVCIKTVFFILTVDTQFFPTKTETFTSYHKL